ncbi:TetR/AcrR family transcriptional regulator [Bosea sp. (in: a-proteobacteria)]|uniref:TetR/AcrR family transcriptional regulator n=1 Tax=Bosea sp. (in: a-proteobacteria) TaxID=1871050 RepID=UPI002633809C|nr:TetR/AcrR family transcriptional regulator [Bosea sp. (in: a-proteobacteria)]MCO5089658.1 TetR/AcrR family transcriptional regulator [Bosea sp. (in: a-proteobacteria)]
MARTAGSDGARTEAAIRRAAIDLIAAKGFEAVTLRGIAEHVGLQASSLYRYYPSKNDLLTTIIVSHLTELLSQWDGIRPVAASAKERLEAFIAFHVRYHAAKPKEVFIANMEMRSLAPDSRSKVVAMRRRYEDILSEILKDGIDEGLFSVSDVRVATFAIIAMLTGLTAWYQEGGRLTKEELVDCYSRLVTKGVFRADGD